MHPTAQRHQPMAEGRLGQRLGDGGLDVFLAGQAVVAVDGVLGDDGPEVVEDVLDTSRAGALTAFGSCDHRRSMAGHGEENMRQKRLSATEAVGEDVVAAGRSQPFC